MSEDPQVEYQLAQIEDQLAKAEETARSPRVVVVQSAPKSTPPPSAISRIGTWIGILVAIATLANAAITFGRSMSAFVTADGLKPMLDDVRRLREDRDAHERMILDLRARVQRLEDDSRKR